jgi:hypothetical protein
MCCIGIRVTGLLGVGVSVRPIPGCIEIFLTLLVVVTVAIGMRMSVSLQIVSIPSRSSARK